MAPRKRNKSRWDQMVSNRQQGLVDATPDIDQEIAGADMSVLRAEDLELGGEPFIGSWTHCASIRAAARLNANMLRAVVNYGRLPTEIRALYYKSPGPGFYQTGNFAIECITDGIDMGE